MYYQMDKLIKDQVEHGYAMTKIGSQCGGQTPATPQEKQASQYVPISLQDLPPFHLVHRTQIPTITQIPKGARAE